MSKIINIEKEISIVPSSFDDDNSSYYSTSSYYPISNGYSDSESDTYAQFILNTGSSANTYIYYNFDTSEIPNNATIISVSCKAKAYVSSTSTRYVSTRQIQMCTGTTTKGSSSNVSTSSNEITLSTGNWTLSELRNAKIRLYGKRGSRSTTSTSYYFRFYGATLTINYEVNGIAYEVTTNSNVSGVTIEPSSQDVIEGENASIIVNTDSTSNIVVKDNNVDVTNLLVKKEVQTTGTIFSYPVSYTTHGNISGTYYQSAIGEGSDTSSTSGSDYCSSSDSTAYIDYYFDLSEIPENAIIKNVTCNVKGHCESTSSGSEVADLQLYSGSTIKGEESSFTSTTDHIIDMDTGNWTREELQNAFLRFTIGYYGGRVSGATFTVEYEIPSTEKITYFEYTITNITSDHEIIVVAVDSNKNIYIKENGSWKKYSKVYKKVNGSWVEQTDLTHLFNTNTNYVKVDN